MAVPHTWSGNPRAGAGEGQLQAGQHPSGPCSTTMGTPTGTPTPAARQTDTAMEITVPWLQMPHRPARPALSAAQRTR